MIDSDNTPGIDFVTMAEAARAQMKSNDDEDPVLLVERVYQLWWHWADFAMFIISPSIPAINPPLVIMPDKVHDAEEAEFVYPIHDYGHKLATSKAADMYAAGMSNCKLFYTIEKMIYLFVERLKSGGIDEQVEVQVAFGGHEKAQRKAFETVINLPYNVVVTNFDPADWGERYLETVRRVAESGKGYPEEAPRDRYKFRHPRGTSSGLRSSA